MSDEQPSIELVDLEPANAEFQAEILTGLLNEHKNLPCKYFYDQRGSQLFDEICEVPEYYLTRTELSIMELYAPEMAAQLGPDVMLVEYGSGSSTKTRLLLDHLETPAAYVPVDISREHLQQTADVLSHLYPQIEMLPVCADFTQEFQLPTSTRTPSHAAVYFPGSTIGNFRPSGVKQLLGLIWPLCGKDGGLLIGIDLKKDKEIIEAAYNDSQGVTAEFNLNLLHRINRELHANFNIDAFKHRAEYNPSLGRVEIGLKSTTDQEVLIGGKTISIAADEVIHTEYSYKFDIQEFAQLAAKTGLSLHKYWTDDRNYFAVLHLVIEP